MGGSLTSWVVTGNLPSLDAQQTPSAWTMYSSGAVLSRVLRFKTGTDLTRPKTATLRVSLARALNRRTASRGLSSCARTLGFTMFRR